MRLNLTLGGAPTATIRIARVDVKSGGQALATLVADHPTKWQAANGQYEAWAGQLEAAVPALVSYKLAASSGSMALLATSYELSVTVEAVLPDGTVLRAADTYLHEIAPEPHVVT